MFNKDLFEGGLDIVPALVAADANSDITGLRVNLARYDRAYLKLTKPAGSAGDDLSIALQQHTAASGGSSKALTFRRLWYKKAASTNDFSTVGQWTPVELTTPSSDLDLSDVNGDDLATDTVGAVVIAEVMADSLDANGGYSYVSYNNEGDDIGNALLINAEWILQGSRFPQAVPVSPLS